LKSKPKKEQLDGIKKFYDFSIPDEFIIVGKTVYIYCSRGYRDTKFGSNFFEKKLKVRASTRNWRTALKVNELLAENVV